jgi:hypothetical protein
MATSRAPVPRSNQATTRGRDSARLSGPIASENARHQTTALIRKIPASTAVVATRGSPSATNCGSRVKNSSAIFGFRRLLRRPWWKAEPRRSPPRSPIARASREWISDCTPMRIR